MTICARCHRTLLRQPVFVAGMALGPKCATAVAGSKPRRSRLFDFRRPGADARQRDLFTEATP
jgi:hypothetical protein